MIRNLVAQGRFYGGAAGAERLYPLTIQSFGLEVKDVQAALVVTGRNTTNAKVHVRFDEGATADLNALIPGPLPYNDIIGTTAAPIAVPATLPATIKGSLAGSFLPYLRLVLGVSGTATDEFIDVSVYAGGKPY